MDALVEALVGTPDQQREYARTYGRPQGEPMLPWALDQFRQQAPSALMGLRAGPAMGSMRAFNPRAPEAPLPKRPDGEGLAQTAYEVSLGRPPGGGPGSGHWRVFGIPVSKSPLAHAAAAGAGYGTWKMMGGDEAWEEYQQARRKASYPLEPQGISGLLDFLSDIPATYRNSMDAAAAARRLGVLRNDMSPAERERVYEALYRRGFPVVEGPKGEQY